MASWTESLIAPSCLLEPRVNQIVFHVQIAGLDVRPNSPHDTSHLPVIGSELGFIDAVDLKTASVSNDTDIVAVAVCGLYQCPPTIAHLMPRISVAGLPARRPLPQQQRATHVLNAPEDQPSVGFARTRQSVVDLGPVGVTKLRDHVQLLV